ncbi:NUDIX domain-containing protein [Patescibacteria group bacterium]
MGKGKEGHTGIKLELSSGGVVYKKDKAKVLWLVTKSSSNSKAFGSIWRLPKGRLDDIGSQPGPLATGAKKATEAEIKSAALKEVEEEGGVRAKIVKKIGTERYFFVFNNQKYLKFVTFYLMVWQKDLPQGFSFETSEIAWLSFDEAYKKLSYAGEKSVLKKAKDLLI